jgi:hypothetical protein
MKALLTLVLAVWLTAGAMAQPIRLTGSIGVAPVFADLMRNGDTVSGWYYVLKSGKQVRLEGKLDGQGFFQLEAYTASSNSHTGTLTGRARNGHWRGNWKGSGAPRAVRFDEVRDTLAGVSGRYRCTMKKRDREFALTTRIAADLSLAKGRVKSISLARSELSDGDSQHCVLKPGALRQEKSEAGILLRAKNESEAQRCSVRLYRAGDYLVIRIGDPSRTGDDCRGAGSTMFCSAHGNWADLILTRSGCRPVK